MPDEKKAKVFNINGKDARITKPLTIGDMKKLKRDKDIDVSSMANMDVLTMAGLVQYILQKANPEITEEDVDSIPTQVLGEIMGEFQIAQGVIDRPT